MGMLYYYGYQFSDYSPTLELYVYVLQLAS